MTLGRLRGQPAPAEEAANINARSHVEVGEKKGRLRALLGRGHGDLRLRFDVGLDRCAVALRLVVARADWVLLLDGIGLIVGIRLGLVLDVVGDFLKLGRLRLWGCGATRGVSAA